MALRGLQVLCDWQRNLMTFYFVCVLLLPQYCVKIIQHRADSFGCAIPDVNINLPTSMSLNPPVVPVIGAMLMMDMAHISGLVATKEHTSPFEYVRHCAHWTLHALVRDRSSNTK